jgi:hypothetical protein
MCASIHRPCSITAGTAPHTSFTENHRHEASHAPPHLFLKNRELGQECTPAAADDEAAVTAAATAATAATAAAAIAATAAPNAAVFRMHFGSRSRLSSFILYLMRARLFDIIFPSC